MKIEYLREFVVLAQKLSFTAASEELFIAQSVLSRHMSALEDEIGARLIDRNSKRTVLTNAGEFFKDQSQQILALYDRTCAEVQLRSKGMNTLKIGTLYYATNDYMVPLQRILKEELPDLEVSFLSTNPDECLGALYRDEVDAILIYKMPYPNSEQFEFIPLFTEPLTAFVNVDNPLAQKDHITLADLNGQVVLDVKGVFRQTMLDALDTKAKEIGFQISKSEKQYSQTESALVELQHQQDGIVLAGIGMSCIRFENVKCLLVNDESCSRQVCLVHKKDIIRGNIPQFLDCFLSHKKDLGLEHRQRLTASASNIQ